MSEVIEMNLTEAIENKMDRSTWVKWKFSDLVENIVEKIVPKDSGLEHYIGLEHLDTESLKIRRFGETSTLIGDKLKIYKGDLIFAKRNAYLKRVAIAEFDAVASAHSMVLRPKSKNANPDFLPFFLMSEVFWRRAIEISVGSLSPTINWKALAKQEFLLPPKDQQAQLAELLWAMDEVVEGAQQLGSCLEGMFIAWLNSQINTRKGWDRKPLSSVAIVQTGVAKNSGITNEPDVITLPYLRVANVQDGFLDLSEVKSISIRARDKDRFLLQKGDLLLTEGGDFDKLGRGYVWQNEVHDCVHQNHVFAVRPNTQLLSPWFLSLIARSSYGKQYFLRCAKKTSNLASINSSQLKEFRVFIPPLSEQNKIVDQFKEISSTIKQVDNEIATSKSLQKSLINQIF